MAGNPKQSALAALSKKSKKEAEAAAATALSTQRRGQVLMQAPNGVSRMPTMNLGGSTGGRQYTPNPFSMGGPPQGGQPPAPPMTGMAPPNRLPSPGGPGNMPPPGAQPGMMPGQSNQPTSPQMAQAMALRRFGGSSPKMDPRLIQGTY